MVDFIEKIWALLPDQSASYHKIAENRKKLQFKRVLVGNSLILCHDWGSFFLLCEGIKIDR